LCRNSVPRKTEGTGNAGRPMRPQPCVQSKKARKQVTTVTPETPGIPRAMVLRLIARSPWWPGFLATIASRIIPRDLTPASGRQDHTTSPSALRAFRLEASKRPPHPALNVRDDRETPLCEAGRRKIWMWFAQSAKGNIFAGRTGQVESRWSGSINRPLRAMDWVAVEPVIGPVHANLLAPRHDGKRSHAMMTARKIG